MAMSGADAPAPVAISVSSTLLCETGGKFCRSTNTLSGAWGGNGTTGLFEYIFRETTDSEGKTVITMLGWWADTTQMRRTDELVVHLEKGARSSTKLVTGFGQSQGQTYTVKGVLDAKGTIKMQKYVAQPEIILPTTSGLWTTERWNAHVLEVQRRCEDFAE